MEHYFGQSYVEEPSTFALEFDYAMTAILLVLTGLMPFFIIAFYYFNFSNLDKPSFRDTYGSVYEGLKLNNSAISFNAIFIVRRFLFSATVFYMAGFPWL